jgi:hypothetical protein
MCSDSMLLFFLVLLVIYKSFEILSSMFTWIEDTLEREVKRNSQG